MGFIDVLILAGFGLPCAVAIYLAPFSRSKIARWILQWGGLIFAAIFVVEALPLFLCGGNILYGYTNCSGGPLAGFVYETNAPTVLAGALIYAFVGPVFLAVAALCEVITRHRKV